jgi:murein DD-endopeptidase MepM/ murein hydrolase activator NlpD
MTMKRPLLAALAASALACWPAAASAASVAAPQLSPLTASVLAPPRPVAGTDGKRHMLYELRLQNVDVAPATVESVAVRAKRGRTLATMAGSRLATVMSSGGEAPTTLAAGAGGTVWLDLALPRDQRVPRALVHRIRVSETVGSTRYRVAYDGARTRVARRAATRVAPPLRGGPYLNFNGCCGLGAHRTALVSIDGVPRLSERFAADFIRIDAQGRAGAGDLSRNESFYTYGEPVYAVGDGRVVDTLNTLKENVPLNEPPSIAFTERTILGNQVVLRLDDGRYVAYGHLKTGSVRVHRGQRVHAGQVVARVGNTGQSGAAHLHFQLSDGVDPLASDGVPYTFKRFTLTGSATNIDDFLVGANADVQPVAGPARRHAQYPMHADVVRFPG